jgi:hypothetical protein
VCAEEIPGLLAIGSVDNISTKGSLDRRSLHCAAGRDDKEDVALPVRKVAEYEPFPSHWVGSKSVRENSKNSLQSGKTRERTREAGTE